MILRIALAALVVLVLGALAFWWLGPREPADLTVRLNPSAIGSDPDAYLARTEASAAGLRPDALKRIVWAFPASRAKTPLAIVAVDGFPATALDVRSLATTVAEELKANLFVARLEGHGGDPAALAGASVNAWFNDLAEALAIGRVLGEDVVIVAASSGATLATLGAAEPGFMENVAGMVLLAPIYELTGWRSAFLDMPYAARVLPHVFGEEPGLRLRGASPGEQVPAAGVARLGALLRATRRADMDDIATPALFVYAPQDETAEAGATADAMEEWGAPHTAMQIESSIAPGLPTTPPLASSDPAAVAARIVDWLRTLRPL